MSRRNGFTLVELVVVVLILGILAAIAVPKVINNADEAADSGVAQTLASIRDAVELYKTQPNSGGYPEGTSATIQTKLKPYIRGTNFPKAKVGLQNSSTIKIDAALAVGGTEGWVYNPATGDIIINSSELMSDGATMYSEL
jgi:general secretion pathway protein G